MPDRLESYNLVNFIGIDTIFENDFLSRIDQFSPISLLRNTYNLSDGYSLINRMLALDMYYTLSENDLPKVTNMCHQANARAGRACEGAAGRRKRAIGRGCGDVMVMYLGCLVPASER